MSSAAFSPQASGRSLRHQSSSAPSNLHTLSVPSNAPNRVSLVIPVLEACTPHFIQVDLGKLDSNVTFIRPYFEPYAPLTGHVQAAANAAEHRHRLISEPFTPYISESLRKRVSLDMYFSVNPVDSKSLCSYDWIESCDESSSALRWQEARKSSAREPQKMSESTLPSGTEVELSVGPDIDDDADDPATPVSPNAPSAIDDRGRSPSEPSPARSARDDDVIFAISQVRNQFFAGLSAPIALQNVVITIVCNTPIRSFDDVRHPLRMCRLSNVAGDTYDAAVEWISRQRTRLLQGLTQLTEDGCDLKLATSSAAPRNALPQTGAALPTPRGRTFLHIITEHLGDPRFCRMLLKHCSRFLRKDAKDNITGRTALQYLFVDPATNVFVEPELWRARVFDFESRTYYRMLELTRLLVEEASVSLSDEDVFGNSVVHYAACCHRRGSHILPLLLTMGAPADAVNLSGKTPRQEMLARQEAHAQLTWDVDEALMILDKHRADAVASDALTLDSPNESVQGASHAAQIAERRRRAVAEMVGNGVDLPRAPLKLVDVVPIKLRGVNLDSVSAFPTRVVDVLPSGYPKNFGPPAMETETPAVRDSNAPNALLQLLSGDEGDTVAQKEPEAQKNESVINEATLAVLRREFDLFDKEGNGWISVSDMRRVYLAFDGYGVSESTAEIDKAVTVMGIRRDGRVTFDEYCILMLRMNRL